jgi:hypothetical protein
MNTDNVKYFETKGERQRAKDENVDARFFFALCPSPYPFNPCRLGNRSLRCSTSCIRAVVEAPTFGDLWLKQIIK